MRTMASQPTIVSTWIVETPDKELYRGVEFSEALKALRGRRDAVIVRADVDASPV